MLFSLASPIFAQAPSWDTSGNRLLNGAYNFREVAWIMSADNSGNLSRAVAQWGTITFDGNGSYTLSSTVQDSNSTAPQSYNINGTYSIAASGFGFMSHPLLSGGVGRVYGLVSQGVFIGSATEAAPDAQDLGLDNLNDLFIAAPVGSPGATNASLNGSYWVAEVNFPALTTAQVRDSLYQAAFNGQGGISAINATGYLGTNTSSQSQALTGANYAFTNGIGRISYGGTLTGTTLLAGDKTIYAGPEGNIFFGGSQTGYDMVVGIKAASGNASTLLNGLYYQAGADITRGSTDDPSVLSSYYGAIKAVDRGGIYGHLRLSESDLPPYDYTYSDQVTVAADGKHQDFTEFTHVIGANGNFRVGFGEGGLVGMIVSAKAPTFSGDGVFIDPTGVVNGGSFTPFTVGASPGAIITIFGTGMAAATVVDGTFPTTLGGVRVLVNGRAAPIYVVSPTQISFVVPWATSEGIAEIQVVNNGVSSNKVTVWRNETTPGVFTVPSGGAGFAAALHANYTVVTPQNMARPGEVIQVYLTGLGAVDPAVPDAAPGPVDPLSLVTAPIDVIIGGETATVSYKGLAPQLTGLYQINVEVPPGTESGNRFLNVSTPDAYTTMVIIPVTGGAAVSDALETRSKQNVRGRRPRALHHSRLPGDVVRPKSRRN